jgi:hypothetical protein
MRLSFAPILAILSLASSSPLQTPAEDVQAAALDRRTMGASGTCTYTQTTGGYWTDYTVYLSGDYNNWLNNWGQGFLDNLNGECPMISSWTWDYSEWNVAGTATFATTGDPSCVEAAAWDASYQTLWGMECQCTGYC